MTGIHPPPDHLSPKAAEVWLNVVSDYEFAPPDLIVLRLALEAYDRAQEARQILARDGLTAPSAHGDTIRAHPMVAVERDSRRACASLLAQLRIEVPTGVR